MELSPWVVSNCLLPNLEACEVDDVAVVHTSVGGWWGGRCVNFYGLS